MPRPPRPDDEMPAGLRPMLATPAAEPPRGEGWAWELKWDGVRAIAYVDAGNVRLVTRNGNEVGRRYPEIVPLGAALAPHRVVLDGELVAFDEQGRPSFERLQPRMHVEDAVAVTRLSVAVPVVYVVFDILWCDGESLLELPYRDRRARLLALDLAGDAWRTPPHEEGDGAATIDVADRFALEGVVAKRLDSRYEPGRRSPAWRKVKNARRQEFVVGGWLEGEGSRHGTIGSLLIGYHDIAGGADGEPPLVYAARVGSGLTQADLTRLQRRFATERRDTSPFAAGSPPKGAHWVEPNLVVEVKFTEWTSGGGVRHPTYLGERDDKDPREVVRERP